MLKQIAMIALLGLSLNCVGATINNNEDAKTVTMYNEDNTNIMVSRDHPEFTLKLKSNPTTGYSWFLREYDANLIEPIGKHYQGPDKALIGAGGYELWNFKMKPAAFLVPHQTALRMNYARPWNKLDSGSQLVFHVTTVDARMDGNKN